MQYQEIWKQIPGWPTYWVSTHGAVRGGVGKILKGAIDDGYHKVCLCYHGRTRFVGVHRLMVEAFISPTGDWQTRHINGDRLDNRLVNLTHGSAKENTLDKKRHGTWPSGSKNGRGTITQSTADEIRLLEENR